MAWYHVRDGAYRARKRHVCYLCQQPIEPGTIYIRRFGYDDGPISSRMHTECERETREWDELDWETFTPGEFQRPVKVEG